MLATNARFDPDLARCGLDTTQRKKFVQSVECMRPYAKAFVEEYVRVVKEDQIVWQALVYMQSGTFSSNMSKMFQEELDKATNGKCPVTEDVP